MKAVHLLLLISLALNLALGLCWIARERMFECMPRSDYTRHEIFCDCDCSTYNEVQYMSHIEPIADPEEIRKMINEESRGK